MEKKIQKMLRQDRFIVMLFTSGLWMLIGYVMLQVLSVTETMAPRIIIVLAGVMACAFSTASSVAVLSHLKRNRDSLYTKEILSGEEGGDVKNGF